MDTQEDSDLLKQYGNLWIGKGENIYEIIFLVHICYLASYFAKFMTVYKEKQRPSLGLTIS